MKCSIIILNWNGANMLRRYLPSVISHCPADAEVLVADNGSTDDSLAVLQSEFENVRVIALDQNYGFAEGYNRVIDLIESEYCVLLNSDVEVTAHWLEPLLQYMDSHPDIAALQPKILADYDRENKGEGESILFEHAGAAGGYIDVLGYPYCRGRIMGQLERDHGQYDDIAEIFWATGACLLTRTRVYKECGGLDSDFFAHMEEIDYCWRLHSRGYRIVCVPQSVVYHLGGGALPYESPQKTFLNFRNCLLMLYKNLPTRRLLWLMPMRCILDYVAALQYLVRRQPNHAKAVIRARKEYHKMRNQMQPKRKYNLSQMTVCAPTQIHPFSILIKFYILGKKTYSQIVS